MTDVISTALVKRTLVEFLTQGQKQARQANESVLVSLSYPLLCNMNSQACFSACEPATFRAFWRRPDEDFWLIGKGSAVEFISDGFTSVDKVADRYNSLLKTALIEAPDIRGVGPIILGGFRFDTEVPKDANWRCFPDSMLVLPRFLFTRSGGSTWLTINTIVVPEADVALQVEALVAELQAMDIRSPGKKHQPVIKHVHQDSSEQYVRYVRSALKDIGEGRLIKVVLARRKILYADRQFSLAYALGKLCRNYPDCATFAIDNGEASFFGSTPESLVRINRGHLSLTCLAGSIARGNSPEEDIRLERQLFESSKERIEHAAVVVSVTTSLKDLCGDLQWDREPRILKLRNVQHLLTSVTGSLHSGNSILGIVKRLHPTPSVAGVPTDRAMSFICNGENDRGWYAAPVGWVDHTGGGEFAVGIRSALLDDKRAILYAGAGIIEGSDPDREFQETELKFQPLMAALGRSR
tara:strand:- start:10812 stop:12215 length:1404 start_codon:yes stop_codon:yes gene_type:complete